MPDDMYLGGNLIRQFKTQQSAVFAIGEYCFEIVRLESGKTWDFGGDGTRVVLVLSTDKGASVIATNSGRGLVSGDAITIEASRETLTAKSGAATLIVSGCDAAAGQKAEISILNADEQYTVHKPWGSETWISGEHPTFSFKRVSLFKGQRTSLQYHRLKRETNVLFEGQIALVYKENSQVNNDNVADSDLGRAVFTPLSAIDVTPGILHRIEALEDTVLYEVSTPHLDDVVRVQDDRGRGDGRVLSEHRQ